MKNIKINLTELGIRLGLVVAKNPDGRKGAEAIAKISPFTLDRWLAGKSPRMPLLPLAQICRGQNVSMNWLLYGDKYSMELHPKSNRLATWVTKIFDWMKHPDTCLDEHYFISEIYEFALGISPVAQPTEYHPDLAIILNGLGWTNKKIRTRTPFSTETRIATVFMPPLWVNGKEPGNEE